MRLGIVKHQGQIGGFANRLEVLVQAGLIRFIVVGGNGQKAIGASGGGSLGQGHCLGGAVRARAGDDGDATGDGFHHQANNFRLFSVGKGGGFPRSPAGDNAICAFGDVPFNQ